MDVSPKQLVSVSAALIPFLEHDDANRALMGSNMQRQAVPLLFTDARSSAPASSARWPSTRACASCAPNGRGRAVTADEIVIRTDVGRDGPTAGEVQALEPEHVHQPAPIVHEGDRSRRATCLPTVPATEKGELALGRNVLVAFMPWGGYNFEDAILLSERLVKDDVFTSIHIEEFEIDARDTKLGKEEITRDIPNVSRRGAEQARRERPGLHRRRGWPRRHPGRQGDAQGRDRADERGEAAAGDLRREGRRRARRLAQGSAGHAAAS
jgi:DNA-directed RNA polymerase beta subunit